MSNESEYDDDFYDWFAELLITQGCPEDKARECVEEMKKPPVHKLGDMTLNEIAKICRTQKDCTDCPIGKADYRACGDMSMDWARLTDIDDYLLDIEVKL